jgi:hypothetical protein
MIDRIADNRPQSAVRSLTLSRILLILSSFFLTISLPLQAFADKSEEENETPVTNEEFLRESVRSLLDRAFLEFPRSESRFVLVNSEEEKDANWLLEDELISCLQSLNFQVALHPGSGQQDTPGAWSLFYQILEMQLSYPQVKRKGFFGHKLVTRKSKLNISFRLEEEESGKVLWTKRGTEERSDLLEKREIKLLNNSSYPFLSPPLPEDRRSRYVEPALVAAVVGGLVYLFFANR